MSCLSSMVSGADDSEAIASASSESILGSSEALGTWHAACCNNESREKLRAKSPLLVASFRNWSERAIQLSGQVFSKITAWTANDERWG